MKHFAFLLLLIAPVTLASDTPDVPDSLSLTVRYISEDRQPIDAGHLPARIKISLYPIPGDLHGIPQGTSLLDVETDVGEYFELHLHELQEQAASMAVPLQKTGPFSAVEVVPDDVRVIRLGIVAESAVGSRFSATTGIAAGVDQPVFLAIAWFDRAVSITGTGSSEGASYDIDISAPDAGFRWIQYEEYAPQRFRITDRNIDDEPYFSVKIVELEWVELQRSGDDYSLLGRRVEGRQHLHALLHEAHAWNLLLNESDDWKVNDIARLSNMINGTGYALLYRDADGEVSMIYHGQSQ